MSEFETQVNKAEEAARLQENNAARILKVSKVPAFGSLPVKLVYCSGKAVCLSLEAPSRSAAAAIFEELNAKYPALPVMAYKGTFAGIKPVCDYDPRDGTITLEGDDVYPLAYDVGGFGSNEGRGDETLRAWFETETERVALTIKVKPAVASCYLIRSEGRRDSGHGLPKGSPVEWAWNGLPNYNERFIFYSGNVLTPHSFSFAFDTSTGLDKWLEGRNPLTVAVSGRV